MHTPIIVLRCPEPCIAYSDASLEGWAFKIRDKIYSGWYHDEERIFLRELRTALMALLEAHLQGIQNFQLMVDNTAVMFALRSQRSPNATANALMVT